MAQVVLIVVFVLLMMVQGQLLNQCLVAWLRWGKVDKILI